MVSPEIWGPPLWYQMHMKTFEYPNNPSQKDKDNIREFFRGIINLLPCEACKEHYIEFLQKRPIRYQYDNRDSLIKWLIDFHNEVNSRTGKRVLSYQEARSIYEPQTQNGGGSNIIIFLIILIILIICFQKLNKR
ncbi:Erv1/Alr family FAD-linked sulfhydryl oxidase [Flavobacteriaceae bacterium]|nr:Erv1/Alr family FAD-linked sulfhydryl oxidase [Flavobacteriaceae bacterium]